MDINIGIGTEAEVLIKPTDVITFVGKDGTNGNLVDISQFALKSDVDGKFVEYSTLIQANAQQILLKANQTTVDGLGNRLSLAESSITVTAQAIALKANKTDLDVITNRLTEAEASIIVNSDKITSTVTLTQFDELKNRLSQAESSITQTASQIASKVSQSEFDIVGQKVNLSESLIVQTANSISSMVSRSELDTVSGRVDQLSSKVDQTAEAITQTVTKTELNALGERVTSAESVITQQAGLISQKVSQTTFNTLKTTVDGLAEANGTSNNALNDLKTRVTNAESSITQNANSISLKVSQEVFDTFSEDVTGDISGVQGSLSGLSTRVSSAESSISQQATQIALKVNTTTFNTLNGTVGTINTDVSNLKTRVTNNEASISVLGTSITSKVSQTIFDTATSNINGNITNLQNGLGGAITRIGTAESSISQLAQSITSKVSTTDFNALGQRVGSAESVISQQATSISQKVSQTDFNGNTIVSLINQTPSTVKILAKNILLEGAVTATSLNAGRTKINVNTNGDFEFFHDNGQLGFRMTTIGGQAVFQAFNDAGTKVFDIDTVSQGGIQYIQITADKSTGQRMYRLGPVTIPVNDDPIVLTNQQKLDYTPVVKGMFKYQVVPGSQPGNTHALSNVFISNYTSDNAVFFVSGNQSGNSSHNGYHPTSAGWSGAFIADGWYVFDGNVGTKQAAADYDDSNGPQTMYVGLTAIQGGQAIAGTTLQIAVV